MSDGTKETAQAILSNPKVATVVTASSMYQTWWIEWGSPVLDAVATIGGVILVSIMIALQWQNLKKALRENIEHKQNK